MAAGRDDVLTPVTQNSMTQLPRTSNTGDMMSTVNIEEEADNCPQQTEDADDAASPVPASISQPLPDKVHLVSSSINSNPSSQDEAVEQLKQKLIPLPVPSSISTIIQSGLAPTTYFDDTWFLFPFSCILFHYHPFLWLSIQTFSSSKG